MKGQAYLILAILITATLVILRLSLSESSILQNNQQLQANLDSLELKNMEKGIRQALTIGYTMPNRSSNVNTFIDFVRSSESARGNTLSGLSIQSTYPNVTGGSNATMNTSIYNFLGASISNLTLTWSYDNSSQIFTNLTDNTTQSTTFTFNTNSNVNYTLSAYYTVSNITTSRNITIPVTIGTSKFAGFYTLTLSTSQSTPVDEFTNTAILNQTQYT